MKTAIIGIGNIGKVHIRVCQELGFEIVAICEIDGAKVDGLSPFFPVYFDYKRMLDEVEIDVVHICTPHNLHAEMIIECLERNIHVLAEKPLSISKQELVRILEAEERSQAQLGVCLQNRYHTPSVCAKEYLKTHKASNGFATLLWHRDKAYYDNGEWRGKLVEAGGGVMINQALHTLDLMQWLMGMPTYCTAIIENLTLKVVTDVEDTAIGLFSGLSNFTFFATNGSVEEYPVELTFLTDEGVLKVTPERVELNGNIIALENEKEYYGKLCYGFGHKNLIADFYDCVKTGRKFSIDGKESAKTMRLIFAMYESKGQKVEV